MKHIIDIDTWERRDNYGFFRTHLNSWYSTATEIDCTKTSAAARRSGRSFPLYYLYAVLCLANEVNELHYRTGENGQVAFHDRVDTISPIAVPGKAFYAVRIPYHENFKRSYTETHALITDIPENEDPYHAEKELMQQGDYDMVRLSVVPKMFFTSITYTVAETDSGCSHPLMAVGKVIPREEWLVFPLSIYVNHTLVDGSHLASSSGKIERYLKEV